MRHICVKPARPQSFIKFVSDVLRDESKLPNVLKPHSNRDAFCGFALSQLAAPNGNAISNNQPTYIAGKPYFLTGALANAFVQRHGSIRDAWDVISRQLGKMFVFTHAGCLHVMRERLTRAILFNMTERLNHSKIPFKFMTELLG